MPEFMKALLQALLMRQSQGASLTTTAQADPYAALLEKMRSDPRYQTMMDVNALATPSIPSMGGLTQTAAPAYLTPSAQALESPFTLRNLSRYFANMNNNP